ncbi:hypothetical protein [Mesorhizobium sp. B1-1-8]|uniref:hypothetical protein n=1 Tax=Mesorhizobium sp. B1-1-8 TaxID=2589976 RepID=UPI001129BAF7|nr:hypothetical protein [Mesorhizobium sp. B1-1-8]UCI09981.1 hypothetical protein FJ974_13465 [Mesorhizobium sp. B1-1-8]
MTTKQILDDFEIRELSLVDSPAQEGALVAITKARPAPIIVRPYEAKMQETHQMEKKDDAISFGSFEEACAHLRKAGLGGAEAMVAARQQHPALFQKAQSREHEVTDQEQDLKKARDGRARMNQIDALVRTTALGKGVSRTDALRMVRKLNPALFDD